VDTKVVSVEEFIGSSLRERRRRKAGKGGKNDEDGLGVGVALRKTFLRPNQHLILIVNTTTNSNSEHLKLRIPRIYNRLVCSKNAMNELFRNCC
jgi:hypothetical protein